MMQELNYIRCGDYYNELNQEQRYQFRREVRALVKWYNYISQITRMFDRELHDAK